MVNQTEAELEAQLIKQLVGLDYDRIKVHDEASVLANLRTQLGAFNKTSFSDREFDIILNHLAKGNVFEKAKTLRDRFQFTRDDNTSCYIAFYDSENYSNNLFQVTNQVTQEANYKNRYDVTLMVNGLPLVQIELKRRVLRSKKLSTRLTVINATPTGPIVVCSIMFRSLSSPMESIPSTTPTIVFNPSSKHFLGLM